ncbi:MAG TPA: 3-oxoadipate enol-lactonase [Alphaproteobacteria bacterium]|jgi:3-oxoadipate enol-lactonase
MPFVKANGIDMHYRESGSGSRALLFVHALGTSLQAWDAVMAQMSPSLRCVSYDLRGHGKTAVADGPYSIGLLARDLLGLMDALDIRQATLCGVSIGGLIAQRAALDAPARVESLVLCDSGVKIGTPAGWQARIDAVTARGLPDMAGEITPRWYAANFCETAPALCEGFRADLAAMSPVGYVGACHALRDADLTAEVSKIAVPTLVVCGAEDVATPPAVAQELATAIAGARLEIMAGVGHLPCVEAPDRLFRLIDPFLAEASHV